MRFRRSILLLSLVSLIGLTGVVSACTIPVFRYALDYWPPDMYEVALLHEGTLSPEAQVAFDRLQQAASNEHSPANIRVTPVNRTESPNQTAEMTVPPNLPWMTIKYPLYSRTSGTVWSGALTVDAVEMVLDSPRRNEIARRLLKGESAVWVLLESGHSQQDEAAASLLHAQLLKMSVNLKVAVPDESGAPQYEGGESVTFSMIRLSRNDPAERVFVQMLLGTEWDLETAQTPIAFPIYGRGRALYALVGDGINAENIKAACEFLIGWCSCQVKDLNPGVDLLISADWGDTIREGSEVYQNTLSMLGLSENIASDVENGSSVRRHILVGILIPMLMVGLAGACVVIWRLRRTSNN